MVDGAYRTRATTERREDADGVSNRGSGRLARRVPLVQERFSRYQTYSNDPINPPLHIGDNYNVQSLILFSGRRMMSGIRAHPWSITLSIRLRRS